MVFHHLSVLWRTRDGLAGTIVGARMRWMPLPRPAKSPLFSGLLRFGSAAITAG
jgi:hypothetical protein